MARLRPMQLRGPTEKGWRAARLSCAKGDSSLLESAEEVPESVEER